MRGDDRGKVQLSDAIIGVATIAGIGACAPLYYDLIVPLSSEAGPLSALLLELVVPSLILGMIISVGVSARRAA